MHPLQFQVYGQAALAVQFAGARKKKAVKTTDDDPAAYASLHEGIYTVLLTRMHQLISATPETAREIELQLRETVKEFRASGIPGTAQLDAAVKQVRQATAAKKKGQEPLSPLYQQALSDQKLGITPTARLFMDRLAKADAHELADNVEEFFKQTFAADPIGLRYVLEALNARRRVLSEK